MAKEKRPLVRIHDLEENQIVDREMNDEEFAIWQEEQKQLADHIAAEEKIIKDKSDLLKKLGITEEEAKLLLS
jgi:predicted metal-binding transcription factor (methanogenesis marker protein 9)